jgi:hypothetical protein
MARYPVQNVERSGVLTTPYQIKYTFQCYMCCNIRRMLWFYKMLSWVIQVWNVCIGMYCEIAFLSFVSLNMKFQRNSAVCIINTMNEYHICRICHSQVCRELCAVLASKYSKADCVSTQAWRMKRLSLYQHLEDTWNACFFYSVEFLLIKSDIVKILSCA